ncbi:MAG: urease accessory protein UreD [Methylococcales bacterium]
MTYGLWAARSAYSNYGKILVVPSKAGCPVVKALYEDIGWRARLSLEFEFRSNRTLLTGRRHEGPLLVQRPFYPEGPVCHVYLLHPPGGVAGGDILEADLDCGPGSEALITTPAAGKFYRSSGQFATQTVRMRVANGATLEWLPQESIVFDRARVESLTRFDIEAQSTPIGWEIICLGRPACGEGFSNGKAKIGLEIWRSGKPLLLEKMNLDSDTIQSICGLKGRACVATMFIYPAGSDLLDQARSIAAAHRYFGATLMDGLWVCRILEDQAEPVRDLFALIWTSLRPALKQRQSCPPRVWAT